MLLPSLYHEYLPKFIDAIDLNLSTPFTSSLSIGTARAVQLGHAIS
jgi:hypothetical protein